MSERVDVSLVRDDNFLDATDGDILCRVEVIDSELVGHDAVLSIVAKVKVNDDRPVNDQRTLYRRDLKLSSDPVEIRIPRDEMQAFSYSGNKISIELHTQLDVDNKIMFDTNINEKHELKLGTKPEISKDTESIIDPSDAFNFFKNLKAIPADSRFLTIVLFAVGCVVVAVNSLIGVHDQISPEELTWIYSHVNTDGEGTSPILNSLAGSGVVGASIWLLMRRQLRKYMQFSLKKLPMIQRNSSYSVGDLVRGRSRVPLHDVTLRIVACNMERGQYKRGSGTTLRTVTFKEPVRGVILYESTVRHIPANQPIAPHFDGAVEFGPMFAALYPPFIALTHGLEVHWEVQLLHPEFVDQERIGPTAKFQYADFLEG